MVVVGGPVHYPAPNQAMWNIQYWLPKTFKSSHLRTTSFSPIVTAVHVGFSFAGILPFFFAVTSSTAAFFAPRLGVALCPIVVFLDKCTCCFPARSLPTSCWPSYWSSKGTSRWGIKRMVPWDGKKRGRWKWSRVLAHRDFCQRSWGGRIGKVMHQFERISTFAIYNDQSELTQLCWNQTKTMQTWLLAVILRLLMFI